LKVKILVVVDFILKPFVKEIFLSKVKMYMKSEIQKLKQHLEQVSGSIHEY
jgi:hypothetical protein